MDNALTPENQDIFIEDALTTFPLSSMPRDITAEVMARIQSVPAPRPFRLTWNDVLLAFIITFTIAALWFSLQNLPPLAIAQLRKESILFYHYLLVNARWLLPALAFSLAGFFAALTIPYLKQELVNRST